MEKFVPFSEISNRMATFKNLMDERNKGWEMVAIFSKLNQFYFTGTMQQGVLIITPQDDGVLYVRRIYSRAIEESAFKNIKPMTSYRDVAVNYNNNLGVVHTETSLVPIDVITMFKKHLAFNETRSCDVAISRARAVKSAYEIEKMTRSGVIHRKILEEILPSLLVEGMSEMDLMGQLYKEMLDAGHHGVARFSMFDTEVAMGQVAFGENSSYPTYFNGPGGNKGQTPAVPVLASRDRLLKKVDLVFADIGCGYDGYHTDSTLTYVFKGELPKDAVAAHKKCREIQLEIASRLVPGAVPAEIYRDIMDSLSDEFKQDFMGETSRQVRFLGHGIGLSIDEYPVIADGFYEPLVENMTIAVEPKKAVPHIGTVGVEDTFVVRPGGGVPLTGSHEGLLKV